MAVRDLRHFLDVLRKHGELLSVTDELDRRFELPEVLRQFDRRNGPALLFEKVKESAIPIVGNLVGSRKRLALAFGLENEEKLLAACEAALQRKIQPRRVNNGSVKEVVVKEPRKIDLRVLPIPIYHEGDASPYITCGVVTSKDPRSGQRSMGLHRIQVKNRRRMGIHLSNPPIARFAREAENRNEALGIAISLGVHPLILLASIFWAPDEDKVGVASRLLGSAVELVACETVNAEVPALAEIVIEGRVLPGLREKEGPFGEITGYYHSDLSHVIEVTAITHREKPILQALHPTVREVSLLVAPGAEMALRRTLRERGFAVKDLAMTAASAGTHVVVSLLKTHDAEPRQLLHFLLATTPHIKHAVVVDEDVDVHSGHDVEWAIASRVQADEDAIIIPGMKARSIDLLQKEGGFVTKLGLDATIRVAARETFKRTTVPAQVRDNASALVQKLASAQPNRR